MVSLEDAPLLDLDLLGEIADLVAMGEVPSVLGLEVRYPGLDVASYVGPFVTSTFMEEEGSAPPSRLREGVQDIVRKCGGSAGIKRILASGYPARVARVLAEQGAREGVRALLEYLGR